MNNIPRTRSLHKPGSLTLDNSYGTVWHFSPLICRSSCTCRGFPCCWLRDCSSEYLFLPADYLTDCSWSSWTGCGWCTEIHRCCSDPCSTYRHRDKSSSPAFSWIKGFGGRGGYRTYLSSIRASRLAWPHLRLWSLLEHFFVKTNPARNPTRMEMTAVLTMAMDRVFSEYWPPPDVSKDPRKESNEYFLCEAPGLFI